MERLPGDNQELEQELELELELEPDMEAPRQDALSPLADQEEEAEAESEGIHAQPEAAADTVALQPLRIQIDDSQMVTTTSKNSCCEPAKEIDTSTSCSFGSKLAAATAVPKPPHGAPHGKMWFWLMRLRRLLTFLPGLTKHGNSFLSDPMLCVLLRIFVVFSLRFVAQEIILLAYYRHKGDTKEQKALVDRCSEYLDTTMNFHAVSLPINLVLALPALNFSMCELFKARCESECAKKKPYKKTCLLTLCEFLVICEIPILIGLLATILIDPKNNPFSSLAACTWQNPHSNWTYDVVFFVGFALGWYAYFLRWKQIVIFHRLHEHLLFQRGFWRGNNRFDYDGNDFLDRISSCWTTYRCQVKQIKVRLYQAAKDGNLEELEKAIEQARALDGLHFSCKWYTPRCRVGSMNSHVRLYSRCRRNPLHVAAAFGRLECVRYLIKQGKFKVNAYDKVELTRLDISALYRVMFDFFMFFTKRHHFSRLQNRDIFGSSGTLLTPLHVAISLGNHEMAALLIHLGADGNASAWSRHRRFRTPPLFWAVSEECVELLLLRADVNHLHVPLDGYFLTPYEIARMAGNHGIADRLQLFGGDMALTPLHDACAKGDLDEVRFYLDHGANPNSLGENCVGYFHRTPLHWAAMRGHREVVKLLLEFGACIDFPDRFGRTPLAWASFFRRVECIEELLEAGADPNVKDAHGYPILSICAASPVAVKVYQGEVALVEESEVDKSDKPKSSTTQEHLLKCYEEILVLWKQHGGDLGLTCEASGDTALHVALMSDNEQAAIAFVRHGLSLTSVNRSGKRAIDCTNSTSIRYAVKKEAGHRDVMISYCHAHAHFAWKVRNALERAHITTWIDQMDPTGITGGAVWRREIAKAIENSTMMLCILCEHYPKSQWCMKELAYAQICETPVLAIQCSEVEMNDELQMYLYTRQIIDFKDTIIGTQAVPSMPLVESGHSSEPNELGPRAEQQALLESSSSVEEMLSMQTMENWYDYDERSFDQQLKLLLDGIHAEVDVRRSQRRSKERANRSTQSLTDYRHLSDHDGNMADIVPRSPRVKFEDAIEQELFQDNLCAFTVSDDLTKLKEATDQIHHEKLQVLIVHADHHLEFCQRLRKSLLEAKWQFDLCVMIDRPSLTSQKQLNDCDVLMVVLSSKTMQSHYVADKLAFCEDHMKPIIPIMLSQVQVDAAKRYTFSRSDSEIHHFNETLGFQQSVQGLIRALTQANESKREQQLEQEEEDEEEVHQYEDDVLETAVTRVEETTSESQNKMVPTIGTLTVNGTSTSLPPRLGHRSPVRGYGTVNGTSSLRNDRSRSRSRSPAHSPGSGRRGHGLRPYGDVQLSRPRMFGSHSPASPVSVVTSAPSSPTELTSVHHRNQLQYLREASSRLSGSMRKAESFRT